jgi:dienelactone hydrolase
VLPQLRATCGSGGRRPTDEVFPSNHQKLPKLAYLDRIIAALANCLACDEHRPVRPASPFRMVAPQKVQVSLPDRKSKGYPMYQLLWVLVATIAYGIATGHCQGSQAGTTAVTFQSSTFSDMRQLLARKATTGAVTVKADLGFPEQVIDRYPAVIIVHTIAGYLDANEGYAAAELRKAGFATLTYDSFAARRTTGAALQGSAGYLTVGVADAYAALRFLSGEPRIDANRIAIIGFSYGGEVAHLAAFETLRSALNPGPRRFAAHVAFYPGGDFGVIAEPGAYTGSPVLMLLGEKDDNLPVTKIESYLAYARAAGAPAPIETVIYPGAYHAWTVPDQPTARFYPDYVSTKKCPLILLGPKQPALLIDGEAKPFDPAAFGACVAAAPGYSTGFDPAVRAQSITDAIRFLQRSLGP